MLHFVDHVFKKRVHSEPVRYSIGGKFAVKAYAADRIVVTAGADTPRQWKLAAKRRACLQATDSPLRLDKPTESRRQLKIGSRWRPKPLKTKFTNWARNFVKDAAHIIETDAKGSAVFLTLTFPGRSAQSLDVVQHASGYLVDRFNRWLRYKCDGGLYTYVWELTKDGAPHLHYMFKVLHSNTLERISEECQSEWRSILLDLCEQTTCDVFERSGRGTWIGDRRVPFVAARPVRDGLAKYLSKYISKSRSKNGHAHPWCPGRWWACSANLRESVLRRRFNASVTFETESQARHGLQNALQRAASLFTSQLVCDPVKCHGRLVVSCSTIAGKAREIAAALQAWMSDGELSPISALFAGQQLSFSSA